MRVRLLLDTPSLYFRAFHGVPESVTAPDGTPVNAVRGLIDMLALLIRGRRPSELVAAFDADWRPAFRVAAIPSYKAHRLAPDGGEQVPAAISGQVPVIEAVLDAIGLARVGAAGFEADDVLGTLAGQPFDGITEIVTGDRDLFQLVNDEARVRVLYTQRGLRDLVEVDEAEVTRRYGIPGRAYAAFATLRGDPSDGLPGVPGVGEKTAATLVGRFGSASAVLAAAESGRDDGFPSGARRKVLEAADYLRAAPVVVAVRGDVPLPRLEPAVPRAPRDPAALVELATRFGLDGPLNRLLAALQSGPGR